MSIRKFEFGKSLQSGKMAATMSRQHKSGVFRWFRPDPEKDRYYLLPGMGGRALRRKQKVILRWAAAAGLLVASALGTVIYLLNRP